MKRIRYLIGFVAITMLSGCSLFTAPKEHPVLQDYVGFALSKRPTSVFSLTSERRIVIVKKKEGSDSYTRLCAEPPPDVAENIASSFRALTEASIKWVSEKDVSAAVELSKSLNTTPASLFYRSQGVQIFRDGLYNLCQAYMNDIIKSEGKFEQKFSELLEKAFILVSAEIPSVETKRNIDVSNQTMGAKSAAESAMQKAMDAADRAEKAAEGARKALEEIKRK